MILTLHRPRLLRRFVLRSPVFRLFWASCVTLLAAAVSLSGTALHAADERYNVILIFSDDQGTVDLNCYGSKDLYTPHLDALAGRGVRFTQFYAAAPVCSPSRGALLTGRYPQRCGVPGNVGIEKPGMPASEVTIAEMLRGAGYRTALVGKWHLGLVNGRGPLDQGFDSFFGHRKGCIDNYSHFFYWSGPNVHDLWRDDKEHWEDGKFFGDLMVREANQFIEANRDRPFFLFLPFNIPHYPLQGLPEFRARYADLPEPRRSYAALMSTLDAKVGEVIGKVDALGIRRRTLIIFLSDHGHSTEVRTMSGGGSAGPYRGSKFSLFEGGIRVPAIVSLPGVIPEGEVRDQFGVAVDWLPTIAEICGVPVPERKIDGKSLFPIIRSASALASHRVFHWQTGGGRNPQWAVREGSLKLVVGARDTDGSRVGGDDTIFLSDLAVDATERHNLRSERPDDVARLRRLHEEWIEDLETR